MTLRLRTLASTLLCSVLALASVTATAAGDYPSHPIRIVVPFGPGTGLDIIARGFAQELGAELKTPVFVENREGAGGTIGAVAAAAAAPDGYTILFAANGPFTTGAIAQGSHAYDPVRDFAPVTKVAVIPMVLVASRSAPFKDFSGMVAYAKANPGKLDYASSGIGTPSQMGVEQIKHALGLHINPVPYRSTSQAMTDVIGGQLPLYMPSFPAALTFLKSSQVRGLAIGSLTRSAAMPDLPTVAELTHQPNSEVIVWYGFLVPRRTPADVIGRLDGAIQKAAATPQIAMLLQRLGAERSLAGPAQFAALVQADYAAGRKLLLDAGGIPEQ